MTFSLVVIIVSAGPTCFNSFFCNYNNYTCAYFISKTWSLKDNDNLASLLAVEMNADLLIILSDVDGIFTGPPSEKSSKMLSIFRPSDKQLVEFGDSSSIVGHGGMKTKVGSP